MHRQMTTTATHHKTDNYEVVTQTGSKVEEINVININTGRTENITPFDTVEAAIEYCDRKQRSTDEYRAKMKEQREAEEKAAAERAAAAARGPLATDRQVSYILSLLAQHDGQNTTWYTAGPTTSAEIAKMTRKEASTYISALKGE
nr:MAG TPA: hypothetical protein [Caudoviricetes sp.]